MKKNNTVLTLALGKLRYHRSRTVLTGIAILLTTALLMAIVTCGVGVLDMNRQAAVASGNVHASFSRLTPEQVSVLENHINVEALDTTELFATITYDRMNGFLVYSETRKEGIYSDSGVLTEGHFPETADEICSVPSFFERMGVEPLVGGKVTVPFRVDGKGEIQTREFTISGLVTGREFTEDADISDSRIAWSAYVSRQLLDEYAEAGLYEASPTASLRVCGEDYLSYDQICEVINGVAADIGYQTEKIGYNKQYLFTMTSPDTDAIAIVAVISLVVILFSALVIYSIYYVSVITDVQEIGKLKALGASRGQIRRLLFAQGALVSAVAVPLGALIGFLLPYFLFPVVMRRLTGEALNVIDAAHTETIGKGLHMFSLPLLLVVVAAVFLTVFLSLLKPIRVAGKVSPVEAIRYQENTGSTKLRKGHREVKVSTLTLANLTRNRKRTTVTILTMGLSCVLFVCVSAVMASMSTEDMARRYVHEGDFRLSLRYNAHDVEYPENNLDSIVQQEYFSEAFLAQLSSIEGVEQITRRHGFILAASDTPDAAFTDYENRMPLSYFTRENLAELTRELKLGDIDYDRMSANNELLCTHVYSFQEYGMALGDAYHLTLYDGDREIPLDAKLTALSSGDGDMALLLMTEDTWNSLGLQYDPTTDIYLHVAKKQYDQVKEALQDIVAQNEHLTLLSMDEEMRLGGMQVSLVKYPVYLLLILIAVIGFMNLINTMITSIVTRKRELGILQSIGLSDQQLARMLSGEGVFFTAGTLLISVTLGNLLGYLLYLWAKKEHFMSLSHYHYPLWETVGLALLLLLGQSAITLFISKKVAHESLIERIRGDE